MKIVLIGYMGSGKSAVGKQLASKLQILFKDLDNEIEILEGNSISQIFSDKGEIYFRKKEREILTDILTTEKNLVLATGGGTPCYSDVMNLLISDKDIITIYLASSLDILTDRIFSEKFNRPLISHLTTKEGLKEFIAKHLFERSQFYNQALYTLRTDSFTIEEVVKEIILKLN